MKIKLTPLNFVSAISLSCLVVMLVDQSLILSADNSEYSKLVIAISLLVLFLSFLADQIFRKFIPTLYKLWVIELMMILLTIFFMVVLKNLMF